MCVCERVRERAGGWVGGGRVCLWGEYSAACVRACVRACVCVCVVLT